MQWSNESENDNVLLPSVFNPPHSADFINGLISRGLYQVNGIKNVKNRLLDLFFTNDYLNVTVNKANPLVNVDPYHPPILFEYEWHSNWTSEATNVQQIFNFKKADFVGLNGHLSTLNFPELFTGKSMEQKVECFHDALSSAVQRFVPSYIKKSQRKMSVGEQRLENIGK